MILKRFVWLAVLFCGMFCSNSWGISELAKLIYVVDGDTLVVSYNSKVEKIRLIGIDTPEIHWNDKLTRDVKRTHRSYDELIQIGIDAKRYLASLIQKGQMLVLEFDDQKRDKYDRILAYVRTVDGVFINQEMIQSGYAKPLYISPNHRYHFESDHSRW